MSLFALVSRVLNVSTPMGPITRATTPDAAFQFVNVAHWASASHYQAAHDDGFRKLVMRPEWAPFRSRPGLYEVVHEAVADQAAA